MPPLTFAGAYGLEKTGRDKTRGFDWLRPLIHLQAMMPMAVPGMVLGIGYILFFNSPANPFNFLYGTMTILVLSTIAHFYSSSHLTAVTALKGLDNEFESVSASLKVPFYKTFWRVTVPVCLPSIIDISRYYFVNAMTTISAVVFLYSPKTTLASISILHMEEAGAIGSAAAMATLIVATSAAVVRAVVRRRMVAGAAHAGMAQPHAELGEEPDDHRQRSDPADPRTPDDLARDQAGDAARLGFVGRRVQRRSPLVVCAATCVDIVGGGDDYVCVPLQGSGTFSVEAAIGNFVPRDAARCWCRTTARTARGS